MEKMPRFSVVLLGIIFDPAKRKILIGRRENDPYIPKLTWAFPGDFMINGEEVGESLKRIIKENTGLEVANLGSVFSRTATEKKDFLLIYFLCEVRKGKPKAKEPFKELKWVSPEELEKYFTTSFHPRLKEYIMNLK